MKVRTKRRHGARERTDKRERLLEELLGVVVEFEEFFQAGAVAWHSRRVIDRPLNPSENTIDADLARIDASLLIVSVGRRNSQQRRHQQ